MTITTPLLFAYPFHQQSNVAWLLHVQRCGCQTLDGRSDLHLHLVQYEHVEATLQENQYYKSQLPPNGGHINFPRRLLYQKHSKNTIFRMDPQPWVAHVGKSYPPSLAFWPLHIPSFPPFGRVTVFSMGDSDLFRACRSKERKLLHKPFVELLDVVHQEHDITKSNHFRMISCTNHVLVPES